MNLSKDFLQRLEFVWWKKNFLRAQILLWQISEVSSIEKGNFYNGESLDGPNDNNLRCI